MSRISTVLRSDGEVRMRFTPPSNANLRAPQTASIAVSYNPPATCEGDLKSWPDEAKQAFNYALGLWESHINSREIIRVHACWLDLDPGILGGAGAWNTYMNFDNAPVQNVLFPSALADALALKNLGLGQPDVVAVFSANTNWYFGTDGNVSSSEYDFATVVLHEVGHGLGFSGSMQVGTLDGQVVGRWGFGNGVPYMYDLFAVNGRNQNLTDTSIFPNTSPQLAAELQSGNLFFTGSEAFEANGNKVAPLYAPTNWVQGTSYSHLDLSYRDTSDSLMTGFLSNGEANHFIGPVTSGLFNDIGWNEALPIFNYDEIDMDIFLPVVTR